MSQVYNIGYRGGCGGFIFLHFLLLSDQFNKEIFLDTPFEQVIKDQWDIPNPVEWKTKERLPCNFESVNNPVNLNKVTYHCGPTYEQYFGYGEFSSIVFDNYKNVMAEDWPKVTTLENFRNLPKFILDEIYTTMGCSNAIDYLLEILPRKTIWLYTDIHSQNELSYFKKAYYYENKPEKEKLQINENLIQIYNNEPVDKYAVPFLYDSNIVIKLQDWVNDPDLLIELKILDKINDKQLKLLNHWKKLHPPNLLTKLNIKY